MIHKEIFIAETRVSIGVDRQNECARNQLRHQKFLLSQKHRQTQLLHTQTARIILVKKLLIFCLVLKFRDTSNSETTQQFLIRFLLTGKQSEVRK